ncbi:MAG TPA: hypothetical protein VMD74_00770, partial [Candidatus Methylomirabilis sp.]|nr:hypothetical protein [Candidatus Methylomirabilis sp.]
MVEGRAIISDIGETKKKIEQMGGIFRGDYIFKDVIFVPQINDYNLNDDYLRLRIYEINNWPRKNFSLVRKRAKKSILKKDFDAENEALDFIEQEFSAEFKQGFEFSRQGWQYDFGSTRIFLEDIENFKPMIEVETETEQ